MKKARLLHVLGAGPWQVPTIRRARELGHRVLVTDYLPDRPGFVLADLHAVVDITDAKATLEVSRRHGIDGIISDTTDTGVRTAAQVASVLGLPGITVEAAVACTDKSALRRASLAAGLPCPPFCVLSRPGRLAALAGEIGFPLVVKPVDNQSGRGVTIVREGGGLDDAFEYALANSREQRVLLESCLAGIEHIVDGFVTNGRIEILGIARKQAYADNPTIASRILYLAGASFDAARKVLEPGLGPLLQALGLRGGIFHAEFMVDGPRAVPIDLAARGGGVLIYTDVLPAVSGVDAVAASVNHALGEPVAAGPSRRRAACIEFLRAPQGRIASIVGQSLALAQPGVVGLHFSIEPGDLVGRLSKKDDRPGFVVGAGDDEEGALAAVRGARGVLGLRMANNASLMPFE